MNKLPPLDDEVCNTYVNCIDALNKMKALHQKKEQIGVVHHSYNFQSSKYNPTSNPQKYTINKEKLNKQISKNKQQTSAYRIKNLSSSSTTSMNSQLGALYKDNSNMVLTDFVQARIEEDREKNKMKKFVLKRRIDPREGGSLNSSQQLKRTSSVSDTGFMTSRPQNPSSVQKLAEFNRIDKSDMNDQETDSPGRSILKKAGDSVSKDTVFKFDSLIKEFKRIEKLEMENAENDAKGKKPVKAVGSIIKKDTVIKFDNLIKEFNKIKSLIPDYKIEDISDFNKYPLDIYDRQMMPVPNMEYFVGANNLVGMSRWIEKNGNIEWRQCYIHAYDHSKQVFTIQWIDHPSKKQVKRMNLILPHEDVRSFEVRRLFSNLNRFTHLMDISLRNRIFSRDILSKCKVYISYERFKHIISRSKIDDKEIGDISYIQHIYDEYVYSILQFYIQYKTSQDYRSHVSYCDRYIKQRILPERKQTYFYVEHSVEKYDSEDEAGFNSNREKLEHPQKSNLVDPNRKSRVFYLERVYDHSNKSVKYIDIRNMFTHSIIQKYNISYEGIFQTLTTMEYSDSLQQRQASYIRKNTVVITSQAQGGFIPSSAIHQNVRSVHQLLNSTIVQYFDIYIGYLSMIQSSIRDIEEIRILDHLTLPVLDCDPSKRDSAFEAIRVNLYKVQQEFAGMRSGYLSLYSNDQSKYLLMQTKFDSLVNVFNNSIQSSLNSMVANSSKKIVQIVRLVLLSFTVDNAYFQQKIDERLSKNTYIEKCKSMIDNNMCSPSMDKCHLPRSLFSRFLSDFRRRCLMVKYIVMYYFYKLQKNELKIMTITNNSSKMYKMSMLSKIKVSYKENFAKSSMKLADKQNLRAKNRTKIYNIKNYMEDFIDDFVSCIYSKTVSSIKNGVQGILSNNNLFNNVASNILCEYKMSWNAFEISPTFGEIESTFKKQIYESISMLDSIPKLVLVESQKQSQIKHEEQEGEMESPKPKPVSNKYVFNECTIEMSKSVALLDECLAESSMFIIASMFLLNSFNHILLDSTNLLLDELKMLIDNNSIEQLETEVHSLIKDKGIIERLPSVLCSGMFRMEISEVTKILLTNIENTLNNIFNPCIYDKFDELIKNNREKYMLLKEKLCSQAPEIDTYIEMKRFLEGEELTKDIETIEKEVKLCRRMNSFEENVMKTSSLITREYLESLSWVNDLKRDHEMALRRTKEALPRFKEEIMRVQKGLSSEFEKTLVYIREFENYNDDKEAEIYFEKSKRLMDDLEMYVHRSIDINHKYEILGLKKLNFESIILQEKSLFGRYFELWNFIANQWNPQHNLWKKEPFVRLDHFEMGRVIGNGHALLQRLLESFRDNEMIKKLLKNKQDEVNKFNKVLDVVKILKDPSFKDRHWDDLFSHIKEADKNDSLGLKEGRPDLNRITLGQLMLANVLSHITILKQIQSKATMESKIEQKIKEIRQNVERITIKTSVFDQDNTGLSIISSIKSIVNLLSEQLSNCLNMLSNPDYPEEFTRELNLLAKLLRTVTDVFSKINTIQNKLIRISPIFKFRELERYLTKKDTITLFLKLREEFNKIFKMIGEKQMRYFIDLVKTEDGEAKISELLSKLNELDSTSDTIKENLTSFFKMIRIQSPRYFYTTDEQILTLCSLIKFPKSLVGFVCNLFKGLSGINISNVISAGDVENFTIDSVVTRNDEIIEFKTPLTINLSIDAEIPLISMIKGLEQRITEYIDINTRTQLKVLSQFNNDFIQIYKHHQEKKIDYQILILCMNILFDFELCMILQDASSSSPSRLSRLRKKLINSLDIYQSFPFRQLKDKMTTQNKITSLHDFVMSIQNLICRLDYLIQNEVVSTEDYHYLMTPKYSVLFDRSVRVEKENEDHIAFDETEEILERDLASRDPQSSKSYSQDSCIIEEIYCARPQKIVLTMMDQCLEYRYELVASSKCVVAWPLFERTFFSLFTALVKSPNVIVKGFENQGKLETVRALSCLLATNYYECDMKFDYSVPTVSLFIYGMISGGYWLAFKNMEKAPLEMLSILASFAEEIRQSVLAQRTKIKVYGEELLVKGSHAIFCTFNLADLASQKMFDHLSDDISDQFRVVHIHRADYVAILSSVVSLVIDNKEGGALLWTRRLLLFSKMYQTAEVVEEPAAKTHSEKTEPPRLTAELTLREVCALLHRSTTKYFRGLHSYYESFREKDGKYRIDRAALALDPADRSARFTAAVRAETLAWLQLSEQSPVRMNAYSFLFDQIFGLPTEKQEKPENLQSGVSHSAQLNLSKMVSAFLEAEGEDTNLPMDEARIVKFVEPFVDIITSSEQGRQFIILGEPNSQKSTLIRLLGFIESEANQVRFPQFWLNLECLSKHDIFGEGNYHGILREILLQSNNINLEDKNTTNLTKLDSLFQSSSDLFHVMSDYKDPAKKGKKNFERHRSWIVFDANSSKKNPLFYSRVNFLITIFSNLYEQREINQFVGFSSKIKVLYEMTSVADLEPRHISSVTLVHIREGVMTTRDRVKQWAKAISRHHEFFAGMNKKVQLICEELILPIIEYLDENRVSLDLIYYVNQLSLLNNFFNYFEIMLNEFRKYYIAYRLTEAKTNPSFFTKIDHSKKSEKPHSIQPFIFGAQMRVAEEANVAMIAAHRNKKIVSTIEDDQIKYLETVQDLDEFENRKIEGLAMLSIFNAVFPQMFSDKSYSMTFILDRFCSAYCNKHKVMKNLFADGLFKLVADKKISRTLFDLTKYHYDFTRGKWTLWESLNYPKTKIEISSSFSNDVFTKDELARLNCLNSPGYHSAEKANYDDVFCFISSVEKTIEDTSNVKQMRYMLDLFLNYKRHVLLISDHQEGKSAFLGNAYLRDLIEQRLLITFTFALQKNISPLVIQRQIENNLLGIGSNTISPPENKRVVVWIDDLQMSINEEKPESLVRNMQVQGGWFSSNKKSFIKIVDCQFLMTMSLAEYNKESTRESISSLNTDVLSKFLTLKTHKMTYSDLMKIYFEQVKDSICDYTDNKNERFVSKFMHQIVRIIYFNKDKLRSLSASSNINLSVDSFGQLFKKMNKIDWDLVSEKQEDVLFVWMRSLMDFFSCDFNLQQIEFETIMKEKQKKMDLIKVPRKSSVFDSSNSQRFSVKINHNMIAQVLSTFEASATNKNNAQFNYDEKAIGRKTFNQDMIIEEDESESQQESKSKESDASHSQRISRLEKSINKSMRSIQSKSNQSKKSRSRASKYSSKSRHKDSNMSQNSQKSIKKSKFSKLRPQSAKSLPKDNSEIEKTQNDANQLQIPTTKNRKDLSSIRRMSKSLRNIELSTLTTTRLGKNVSVIQENGPDSNIKEEQEIIEENNDISRKSSKQITKELSKESSEDGELKEMRKEQLSHSKESSLSAASASMDDEDEKIEDDEESRNLYKIDSHVSPNLYFKLFIQKVMCYKASSRLDMDDILRKVCFDKKHIFDEVLLKEMNEVRENEEDNEEHTFVVVDGKNEREMMSFMKGTLKGFIMSCPEALFSLKLDGGNFPLLVHHFSMLSLSIMNDEEQIFVSSVKSILYSRSLVTYICKTLWYKVDFIDMIGNNPTSDQEPLSGHAELDAYEKLLEVVSDCYKDVWRLKKRVVMIHVPNSASSESNRGLLDRVLSLVSSVVLNTEMLAYHLDYRMRDMVEKSKKDKLYVHYSEFELKFTIRSRMRAFITFIILTDCTQNYIDELKVEKAEGERESLYAYLLDNYTNLAGKFNKVVLNGIKCLEPEDAPGFYQSPLPFEEIEVSPFCARAMNIEMNYLRCVDKDRDCFVVVRPYNENIILHNVVKYAIRMKFNMLEADSEALESERQKNMIVQRVEKRKEVIRMEVKQIDGQIEQKEEEKKEVFRNQLELEDRRREWCDKKAACSDTFDKLHIQLAEYMREERLHQDLRNGILDTVQSVREYRDKEVQLALNQGGFYKSRIYSVYSVLWGEMFNLEVENPLSFEEIKLLTEENVNRERVSGYSAIFEEACKSFQTGFVERLACVEYTMISEEKAKLLCDVVERLTLDLSSQTVYSSIQRIVMKMMDSSIEFVKLEYMKIRRDLEVQRVNESVGLLELQSARVDKFIDTIDEGLKDKPLLITRIEERIHFLEKKKTFALDCIALLSGIVADLERFHGRYGTICQPLLDEDIPRETLVEVLTSYICTFNKYPYQVKKKMLYVLMKNVGLDSVIFTRVPIYEILSSETLMTEVVRNKIPCNNNFLINLAIIELVQEEQTLLFPMVLDRSKLVLKWLASKHLKSLEIERYTASQNTQEQIEACMTKGHVYVAVDPNEELLKFLRPIIEWQFRRFSENILLVNNNTQDISDSIVYYGKNIHVNKGFFLYIVLEILPLENIDQHLMNKMMVVDNNILNESIFCETIADELSMNLDSNTRSYLLSEFMNKSLQNNVMEKYKKILRKGLEFNFLKDHLENELFKQLQQEMKDFEVVLELFDRETAERNKNVEAYQEIQRQVYSLKYESEADEEEFTFLNFPYAFKITGMIKLINKFIPSSNQFWIYYLGLHKMKKYVGDSFSINYDILTHIIKYSISISEIKVSSSDIEKRTETFIKMFNRIDRQVYTYVCAMIPASLHHVFSYILTTIVTMKHTSNIKSYSVHNSLFLLSDKIIHKKLDMTSFSSHMYRNFNQILAEVGSYFKDRQPYLPPLINNSIASIQENEESIATNAALLGKSELEQTDNVFKDRETIFSLDNRFEISVDNMRDKYIYEEYSEDIVKQVMNEVYSINFDAKNKDVLGSRHSSETIFNAVKAILSGITLEGSNLNLRNHTRNNTAAIQFNNSGVPLSGGTSPTHERRGTKVSHGGAGKRDLNFSILKLAQKRSNLDSRKSLKDIAEFVMEKNKTIRYSNSTFTVRMAEYLNKTLRLISRVEDDIDVNDDYWNSLIYFTDQNTQDVESRIPDLPNRLELMNKYDIYSIGMIIKYSRPDMIESYIRNMYNEIRGVHDQNNIDIYTYSTNKRCTALIYNKLEYNPIHMIDRLCIKMNSKYTKYNCIRGNIQEYKQLLLTSISKGTWIVVDNLHLLSPIDSMVLIKDTNSTLDRSQVASNFRIFIVYRLHSDLMHIKGDSIPIWFGVCYYIFLDRSSSIREEMSHLVSLDLDQNRNSLLKDLNTQISRFQSQPNPSQGDSAGQSQTVNHQMPLPFEIEEDHESGSKRVELEEEQEEIEYIDKKKQCNLIEHICSGRLSGRADHRSFPRGETRMRGVLGSVSVFASASKSDFTASRSRTIYLLKYIISIIRQRKMICENIIKDRIYTSFNIAKDVQLDDMLKHLFNSVAETSPAHPHILLLNSVSQIFSASNTLSDYCTSPVLFYKYYTSYILDLPATQDVLLDFGGDKKYKVPSLSTTARLPLLYKSVQIMFPFKDSLKLFGMTNNDEMLNNYQRSVAAHVVLTENLNISDLLYDHGNHIEDFNLDGFTKDNKKSDKEVITRFYLNSIEYGFSLIQNHEFKFELKNDLKNLVEVMLKVFSDSILNEIHGFIVLNSTYTVLNPGGAGDASAKKPAPSPQSPMVDHRRFSILSPVGKEPESEQLRSLEEDFYAKTGFIPKKSKIYMTLNSEEKQNRLQFRRFFMMHEYRALSSLVRAIFSDLQLVKFSIEGDLLCRDREHTRILIECISGNRIPEAWHRRLFGLNLDVRSFKDLVKSIFVKIDALFSLSKDRDLPPIINIDRLVHPSGFIMNVLQFNNIRNGVPIEESCLMLSKKMTSDKSKIYQNSMVWKVSGLKIRGGKVDEEGFLVDEEAREFFFDIGPLHLEIARFEKAGGRCLEGFTHVPIVFNINYEYEADLQAVFEEEAFKMFKCEDLKLSAQKRAAKYTDPLGKRISEVINSAEANIKSQTSSKRLSMISPFAAHGSIRDVRNKPEATNEKDEKRVEYIVRIPVVSSCLYTYNPIVDPSFYIYFHSFRPQHHWIDRFSYATFEQIQL